MTALRFYFDFISPYAYLGWVQVKAVAERHQLALEPIPVLFAAMLNEFGHKGPAEIEPKRVYTFKHITRLAHDLGVPLRPPPAHPFKPLLALRIAHAASAEHQVAVIDRLFDRTWATGEGVTDPEAVMRALDDAGLPGEALVAAAQTPEIKGAVRDATARALASGSSACPPWTCAGSNFGGRIPCPTSSDSSAGMIRCRRTSWSAGSTCPE